MSRSVSYKKDLMIKSAKETKGLKYRDIKCNVCGHKLLIAYEDYVEGHVKSYCNKCHDFRVISAFSGVDTDPPKTVKEQVCRDIRCPICDHKMLIAYLDASAGHIQSYCNKCHEYRVIDFKRFRSGKKS